MDVGIAQGGVPSPADIVDAVESRFSLRAREDAGALAAMDLDILLATGWADVRAYLRAGGAAAILAIDEPLGLAPVARNDLGAALDEVASGTHAYVDHTTLTVTGPEASHTRATQAMAMTTEPATISEFAVHYDGEQICEYRADGVVVATPATSVEYARAAGGPRVDTEIPAAVVVAVAPYRTNPDEWVLREAAAIEVVRDEGAVGLFVDDARVGALAGGDRVRVEPAGHYRSVRVGVGRSPLAADR